MIWIDEDSRGLLKFDQSLAGQFDAGVIPYLPVRVDEVEVSSDKTGCRTAVRRTSADNPARKANTRSAVVVKVYSPSDTRPRRVSHEGGVVTGEEYELVKVCVSWRVGSAGDKRTTRSVVSFSELIEREKQVVPFSRVSRTNPPDASPYTGRQ